MFFFRTFDEENLQDVTEADGGIMYPRSSD